MRQALVFIAALLVSACGDKLGTGTFPQINVTVDTETFSIDGTAFFGQALQREVSKSIRINNTGTGNLRITGIDWDVDEVSGARKKNQYVEIDFRGAIDANSFPYTIDPSNISELAIAIVYTPPLGKPLDDFTDSVLLLKSNARGSDGRSSNNEIRITFSMRQDIALPRVTPSNYRFQNATLARGETQEFRIYNDEQLATASFRIQSVRLETPSQEFTLQGLPSTGTVVLEPGNPGYQEVVFSVTYQPKDDLPDSNNLLIETDVSGAGTLRVPLTTGTNLGSYSLSFSHVNELDFTNVTSRETRSVLVSSDGPGTLTIELPEIEPAEARADFTYAAFIPATTPEGTDTEIPSWPRGLNVGRTIRIDVTYQPANDGTDTANGELIVPFDNPDPGKIIIPIFSGEPKSKISLAPANGNVGLTGVRASGDSGTRKVVVYNDGNGPLQVEAAEVMGQFDLPAVVWGIQGTFQAFTVPPGGLRVIELSYDIGAMLQSSATVSEVFELTYFNDFTGTSENLIIGLLAEDIGAKVNPTANAGTYSGVVAGEAFNLSGLASTAGSGIIEASGYVWYLTAKPASSMARLNSLGAAVVPFLPDIAGSYTFELFVFARDGATYLLSEPVSVTVTVGAAP